MPFNPWFRGDECPAVRRRAQPRSRGGLSWGRFLHLGSLTGTPHRSPASRMPVAPVTTERNRLAPLDGIRAFAVTAVNPAPRRAELGHRRVLRGRRLLRPFGLPHQPRSFSGSGRVPGASPLQGDSGHAGPGGCSPRCSSCSVWSASSPSCSPQVLGGHQASWVTRLASCGLRGELAPDRCPYENYFALGRPTRRRSCRQLVVGHRGAVLPRLAARVLLLLVGGFDGFDAASMPSQDPGGSGLLLGRREWPLPAQLRRHLPHGLFFDHTMWLTRLRC